MNQPTTTNTTAGSFTPSHDEIVHCARELWTESGRPDDRDDAIWLEAERRLILARREPVASGESSRATVAKPRSRAKTR